MTNDNNPINWNACINWDAVDEHADEIAAIFGIEPVSEPEPESVEIDDTLWHVETAHTIGFCAECTAAMHRAISLARCTGSTGSTHTDGEHTATVTR